MRGEELGLRLQDQAILKRLQEIGGERGAGRGDVDDQLRRAGRRRLLRSADAFYDAVACDAGTGKEAPRQVEIFGGDAKPAAVHTGELGGDILEVRHAHDIDPAIRHGDHDIGPAEAERRQELPRCLRRREASRGSDPRR